MNADMKISVVINTLNAEEFLERALESVKEFDEIVICDMYSDDRTVEIASRYSARIVYHERTGVAEPARAFAISHASHPWILVIDADEIVPPALKKYLYDHIKQENPADGLWIPRKNYLMGRFMHSYYPDHILRFFSKDKSVWPPEIHSLPKVDGRVEKIPAKRKDLAFIHLGNEPIRVTIAKMNRYTEFEAERRQHRKYGWFALIFHPWIRFMRLYIFKGGFRDGIPGYIWAKEYAYYKFISVAKTIESKVKPEDWDKDLLP